MDKRRVLFVLEQSLSLSVRPSTNHKEQMFAFGLDFIYSMCYTIKNKHMFRAVITC